MKISILQTTKTGLRPLLACTILTLLWTGAYAQFPSFPPKDVIAAMDRGAGEEAYIQEEIFDAIDISGYPLLRDTPIIAAVLRIPAKATAPVPVMIAFPGFGNNPETYWNRTAPNGRGVCTFNPHSLLHLCAPRPVFIDAANRSSWPAFFEFAPKYYKHK